MKFSKATKEHIAFPIKEKVDYRFRTDVLRSCLEDAASSRLSLVKKAKEETSIVREAFNIPKSVAKVPAPTKEALVATYFGKYSDTIIFRRMMI